MQTLLKINHNNIEKIIGYEKFNKFSCNFRYMPKDADMNSETFHYKRGVYDLYIFVSHKNISFTKNLYTHFIHEII